MLNTGDFEKILLGFRKLKIPKAFWLLPPVHQSEWEFCLEFTRTSVPDKLMKHKSFLWLNVFYALLCSHSEKVLTDRGKWCAGFSAYLKREKFPGTVITEIENMFYHSLCLLDFQQVSNVRKVVSLAKKLKMLDSPLRDPVLYLSRKYLSLKHLKVDILDKVKQAFEVRSVSGRLASPLVNGEDLKALGVVENRAMAELLENLYDYQLEHQVADKEHLLRVFEIL